VLLGLIRLSREDILILKGMMATCLIANGRDGLSVKIVSKVGLLGFACNFRVGYISVLVRYVAVLSEVLDKVSVNW